MSEAGNHQSKIENQKSEIHKASPHVPVMVEEVIEYLSPREGGRYIDGTIGFGGHSSAVLEAQPGIELLGIDRDEDALRFSEERLGDYLDRVSLKRGVFSDLSGCADEIGWEFVDGILFDLGISSFQVDQAPRGFSFQADGPLDMRMDRRDQTTASRLLNRMSERELKGILRGFGEEPQAGRIARAIVAAREDHPWERTLELAALIRKIDRTPADRHSKSVARCFQALRIAVNRELEHLEVGLHAAIELLAPGGRLVVISFHSLEDRMVKEKFRYEASDCICPPGLPICRCGKVATVRILTKKPITPGEEERQSNRRAAPAKLRVAEKLSC